MNKDIQACFSALDTLSKQESRLYRERSSIPDRYHSVVNEIQRLQDEYHDICEIYGYNSPEANASYTKHSTMNAEYFYDRQAVTIRSNERINYIMNAQRALRETYRKKLGDMVYMSNVGAEHELNEYFEQNGIKRSNETDYNKNRFRYTYTLLHTKSLEEYAYFMTQMMEYFEPNTWDNEGYLFKVGYTQHMYLEFRNEWWYVMDGNTVLFEDPLIIEALQYMEMTR